MLDLPEISESNNMNNKANVDLKKTGFLACAALAVANMVGTGVFTSLGFQVAALPSPFLILSLWVLGGVAAFCGAICYSELSAMLPGSGGEYHFLREVYHPALGFMAAFVSVAIGFAAPVALAAMAFGKYGQGVFPEANSALLGWGAIVGISLAHSVSVRASGVFQVIVTSIKVTLIGGFLVAGYFAGKSVALAPLDGDFPKMFSGAYGVSLMYVMYAYWGWNAASYIIGEVRNPQKTVPAALLVATAFVTALYVLINAIFLGSAPMADLSGKLEVGKVAAEHLFGNAGGRVMAGIIAVGLLSSMSAMMWAGPRVTQMVGKDFPAFFWLGRTSVGGVPRNALFVQALLVGVFFLTGSFEMVLVYTSFALTVCSSLAVLGVIVMRVRRPDLARPFRCWGYPFTPLVYLAICGLMLGYSAVQKPVEALAGSGTLAIGLLLYALTSRIGRDRSS